MHWIELFSFIDFAQSIMNPCISMSRKAFLIWFNQAEIWDWIGGWHVPAAAAACLLPLTRSQVEPLVCRHCYYQRRSHQPWKYMLMYITFFDTLVRDHFHFGCMCNYFVHESSNLSWKSSITDACSSADCCPLLTICHRCCSRHGPDGDDVQPRWKKYFAD